MFGTFKPTPKPQRTNKRIFAAANIGGISTEVQIRICGMKCPVLREGTSDLHQRSGPKPQALVGGISTERQIQSRNMKYPGSSKKEIKKKTSAMCWQYTLRLFRFRVRNATVKSQGISGDGLWKDIKQPRTL